MPYSRVRRLCYGYGASRPEADYFSFSSQDGTRERVSPRWQRGAVAQCGSAQVFQTPASWVYASPTRNRFGRMRPVAVLSSPAGQRGPARYSRRWRGHLGKGQAMATVGSTRRSFLIGSGIGAAAVLGGSASTFLG